MDPIVLAQKRRSLSLQEIEQRLRSGKDLADITKHDLPTPCLLLDLDRFEANVAKMRRHAKTAAIGLRPHAKTHKCPEIARRQIESGALGVCTATMHEAEVMAAAGVRGILITSEMVGPNKIERLVRLTREAPDTMSVVDNALHATQLNEASAVSKIRLNVMLDINVIGGRSGVNPGDSAAALAEKVMKLSNLNLRGVHAYSGASAHVEGFEQRKAHSEQVMAAPLETFARLKKAGMPVEILSGGSTGTYNIDTALKGMTELQVGSYIFMDTDYRRIGGRTSPVYDDFAPSLAVLATVISKNHSGRATIDAGAKAFATDRKHPPEVVNMTGVDYQFNGDEHGALILTNPSRDLVWGQRVELIVPHCDPNVNLFERLYCMRAERVEAVWRIAARGHA